MKHYLNAVLGKPAYVTDAEEDAFMKLLSSIREEVEPETIFDEIEVRQYAESIWEETKLKGLQVAMLAAARPIATKVLFRENLPARNEPLISDFPQVCAALDRRLSEHKITNELVEAEAFYRKEKTIETIERMIGVRRKSRSRLEKNAVRRRAGSARNSSIVNQDQGSNT